MKPWLDMHAAGRSAGSAVGAPDTERNLQRDREASGQEVRR